MTIAYPSTGIAVDCGLFKGIKSAEQGEDDIKRDYPVLNSILEVEEKSGADLTDHQILYKADVEENARFTPREGKNLAFWRESTEKCWLKIDSLPANAKRKIFCWKNDCASPASDAEATFEFFDHFDSYTWTTHNGSPAIVTIDGRSALKLGSDWDVSKDLEFLLENWALEYEVRIGNVGDSEWQQRAAMANQGGEREAGWKAYDSDNSYGPYHRIVKWDGNTADILVDGGTSVPLGVWLRQSFSRYGEKFRHDDSENIITATDSAPYGNILDTLELWRGTVTGYAYFDWIALRKYVEPEPTVSIIAD